ncbi:cytochrome P450 6k1-like [Copidosoma floridanum]|uniref:cytochrome P450 6k1-like n=1 Tax=Copidosoma floridanum TaxID=29053 RepID=UPI0006C97E66|nr:cytochrome P450 6k1-like [Copidosoma floridanum]
MAMIPSELINGVLVCACLFLVGFYVYVTRYFKYWKKQGVKHSKPSFPFGNFGKCIFLQQSIHEFIDDMYRDGKGEKMVGFYVLDRPYVLLRDPELLRSVFIRDFNIFSNKVLCNNKSDPFGTHMLFLETNPPWKHIRQKLSPMFTSGKLKKNFDLMMEIYKDLDFHLNSLGVNDENVRPIEVRELSAKLMTDVIGITAYNIRFDSLRDPDAPFRKIGKSLFRSQLIRYLQCSSIFFIPAFRAISNAKFFDAETEFFENMFSRIVDERIMSGNKKNDFVDLVINMIGSEEIGNTDEIKVGHRSWMSQLAGIFSAGFETSSTTTTFSLYQIAVNPEVQKRLRDELANSVEKTNGKLTYDVVTDAPYLNMIVREALRMFPILTWLDRVPDVDYTFPGTNVTIKKGTPVIFPLRSMQMDPKYYKDPEKFDPERFSDENKSEVIPFTYAPFGEGPRNCIGGRLGLLQVKLATAYLVMNYEITPCEKTPIPLKCDRINALNHPAGDICLNFRKVLTSM